VEVGVREAEDGYVFRVSDNGVGFPEDGRDEVFQLFYRAAPARAAGLGVGLAVVKMLVEQSGGQLTVASGQGEGSTFLVTLPRYDVSDFLV
jgi:two-component system phosphate regulon sensor histidine kinase PhoR